MSGCEYGASQDVNGTRLRIYTQNECENKLGGEWYANGECYKKDGSGYSYSWECRDAANSVVSSVAATLSGGRSSSIPSWAIYAGGAGAIVLAWKLLKK